MFFSRRKKLPLTIDPNDLAAIAHENEVLAREVPESLAGGETKLPTAIGYIPFMLDAFAKFRLQNGKIDRRTFYLGPSKQNRDGDSPQPPQNSH